MLIGICGKSGSGKSTVASILKEKYNAIHLEIDKVGHHVLVLEDVKKELVNAFGKEVIKEGKVNQKQLGNIVFEKRNEMEKLTDITWKYMQQEIDAVINEHKNQIILLDWLLLANTKYFDQCDIKILLNIPYEVRLQRAMKREHISEEAFALREKASVEYDPSKFDLVIEDTNLEAVKRKVLKIKEAEKI